jgi:hypothetical protein
MNQKVTLIAGSLLIISVMTVAGVVIVSSAQGIDQTAAVYITAPHVVQSPNQDPNMVMVPRDALARICSSLVQPVASTTIRQVIQNKIDDRRASTTGSAFPPPPPGQNQPQPQTAQ